MPISGANMSHLESSLPSVCHNLWDLIVCLLVYGGILTAIVKLLNSWRCMTFLLALAGAH
jgi:hypothetical protein